LLSHPEQDRDLNEGGGEGEGMASVVVLHGELGFALADGFTRHNLGACREGCGRIVVKRGDAPHDHIGACSFLPQVSRHQGERV